MTKLLAGVEDFQLYTYNFAAAQELHAAHTETVCSSCAANFDAIEKAYLEQTELLEQTIPFYRHLPFLF